MKEKIQNIKYIDTEEEHSIKDQADRLAKITFLLARACEDKELQFTQQFNLTNAEFRCMRFLKENEFLSVKELAAQMDLTPGRITHIITSLEQKDYIKREIDINDRRNIKVCLTDNAKPFINEVIEKHTVVHEKVLEQIPEEHREYVLNAIKEVYDSLNIWNKSNKDK